MSVRVREGHGEMTFWMSQESIHWNPSCDGQVTWRSPPVHTQACSYSHPALSFVDITDQDGENFDGSFRTRYTSLCQITYNF